MSARDADRIPLAALPTPLEAAPRLGAALGLRRLFVKRDDLTGLGLGGNKARKLERLGAAARSTGADILVTGGGAQSNHARTTAAAARRLGMDCHLVLGAPEPESADDYDGNLLLDTLFGATLEFTGRDSYYDIEADITAAANRLRADGRRPYAIPVGGASIEGAMAYADAARELLTQLDSVDWIFVADGSGGTHGGLLAGLAAAGRTTTRVVGVDVGTRPDLDDAVPAIARQAAATMGTVTSIGPTIVEHNHVGSGYGAPDDFVRDALELAARSEGLVLDPVYSAKAFAALTTWARSADARPNDTVVFWHTGGSPALFASSYRGWLNR